MPFSYPDVVLPGQPAKASHVSSIRTYIDQTAAPLPPQYRFPFTWANIGPGAPILAKYFTEMRDAIQLLWNFKSRGPLPNWTSGVTPGGPSNSRAQTAIRASDVTDLRRWLNQYIDNHAPLQQGIDSKSFDANNSNKPIVLDSAMGGDPNWNWVGDVQGLWNSPLLGRLRVRTVITAPGEGEGILSGGDVAGYNTAFQRYASAGIRVYPLIGSEFYRRFGIDPYEDLDAPLNGAGTNAYIEGFAAKAGGLVTNVPSLRFNNVTGFIIFNEPNVGGSVRPENFAALLLRCRATMGPTTLIYAGGLQVGPGYDPNPLNYLAEMYTWVSQRQPAGSPWPWNGVNFHFHHNNRSAGDINLFFQGLRALMARQGDDGDVIIGEWGVTQQDFAASPGGLSVLYGSLIANAPTIMFFFAHHPVADPEHPATSTWGLRDWVAPIGVLVSRPTEGAPFSFRLTDKNGPSGAFYAAYDNLIGT